MLRLSFAASPLAHIARQVLWVSLACSFPAWASGQPDVFPKAEWDSLSPAEAGLDRAKLQMIADLAGGHGCVVRHGRMVFTWGDPARKGDVASACKPLLTHFMLKALEDKKIDSVDEAVSRFEPRLKDLNTDLNHKDRGITWRHLVNQTSCYGSQEAPGTAFDYNDYNFALLFDTLFLKVYGATLETVDQEVLRPQLMDLLQCQDDPTFLAFGIHDRPGRLAISVRDFARFGLLYLHKGQWNGQSLLRSDLVELAISNPLPNSIPRTAGQPAQMIAKQRTGGGGGNQTDHKGSYSFMWWTNGLDREGQRHWPDAPLDTFGAFGHGGQRAMVVLPSRDLIIVWNDSRVSGDDGENAILKLVKEACLDEDGDCPNEPEASASDKALGSIGPFAKWEGIHLSLPGPDMQSRGQENPFAVAVVGVFTSPNGQRWEIPGYFDGDGQGQPDGDVWRVSFSADEPGKWSFVSRSDHPLLDGWTTSFTVTDPPPTAQGFNRWGRLEAVGTPENGNRYLKFRDGPWWLKAGCDDPENFLGAYRNYDTLSKRKAAIDFLAERGINSLYIMSHNIDGDDHDVWPWLGATPSEAKRYAVSDVRFNIAKLQQWQELFDYMQQRGVVVYLVLEDDSAWKGYNHERYYRELVARFGYLSGLVFNLGEEHNENYRLSESLALAEKLAALDPYDHPRGIHNVNSPVDSLVDSPHIDITSIQTGNPDSAADLRDALRHNQITLDWLGVCDRRRQRRLVINFDEGRPELTRAAWWAAYLGGGVWEAHVPGPYDQPLATWESTWNELGGTRAFMESLPFESMTPQNDRVVSGTAFCLASPGIAYALYLPEGKPITVELAADTTYSIQWWNPANSRAGEFQSPSRIEGGVQRLTPPGVGDWAVKILKVDY